MYVYACMRAHLIVGKEPSEHRTTTRSWTHDQDTRPGPGHQRSTRQPEKRGTPASGKPEYICVIADNEKKVQKKLKKMCK